MIAKPRPQIRTAVVACVALAAAAAALPAPARAQEPIALELNKLDQRGADCRLTFLIHNSGADRFAAFETELVLFGDDGIIEQRFTGDVAPLRPAKVSVVSFDVPDLKCQEIGQVLLNDVLTCQDADGDRADCVDQVTVSSSAGVALIK